MTMPASITRSLGCVVVLAAMAASASAQERWPRARRAPVRSAVVDAPSNVGLEFSARAYGSWLSGMAIDPGPYQQGPSFSELFRTGGGVGIAGYVPFYTNRPTRPDRAEVVIGPMVAVDRISFAGQWYTDPVGDSFKPRGMDITRIVFGGYLGFNAGSPRRVRFHGGAQMGIGPAWIGRVPAEVALTGSGLGVYQGTLYDATSTFAFEASLRAGVTLRLIRGVELSFLGIMGVDFVGPPDNADGPGNPIRAANAHELMDGFFGLSMGLTFGLPG